MKTTYVRKKFIPKPDLAAEFGAAVSLYNAAEAYANANRNNLSEVYQGYDELMRQCMRAGREFEAWSCKYVDWDRVNDVWPYLLEDKFGDIAIEVVGSECHLTCLGPVYYRRIAVKLKLPLRK